MLLTALGNATVPTAAPVYLRGFTVPLAMCSFKLINILTLVLDYTPF